MDHHHHHHHPAPEPETTTGGAPEHLSHADHSGHNHPNYFNINADVTVLFSGWLVNSRTGLFAICLTTIVLGMLYQGIKHLRVYVHRDIPLIKHSPFTREHTLQTLLYGIQIIVSNVLMLVIMTYNVWVCICTVAGLGIGFFLLEWHRPKVMVESCHQECSSKPISRGTTVTRLSVADIKVTNSQELEPLNDMLNQCEGCRDTRI